MLRKSIPGLPQNQFRSTIINSSRKILCTIISLLKVVEISKETLRGAVLKAFSWRRVMAVYVAKERKLFFRRKYVRPMRILVGADFFFKKSFLISRPQVIRYRIRGFQDCYRITVDCARSSLRIARVLLSLHLVTWPRPRLKLSIGFIRENHRNARIYYNNSSICIYFCMYICIYMFSLKLKIFKLISM